MRECVDVCMCVYVDSYQHQTFDVWLLTVGHRLTYG